MHFEITRSDPVLAESSVGIRRCNFLCPLESSQILKAFTCFEVVSLQIGAQNENPCCFITWAL